jgi:hypothetical protein
MRLVVLLLLVVGCAHDVSVRFPAPADAPTGKLVLLLTQSASDVSVAINGTLVVEDEHTQKISIDAVPAGTNEVIIAANGTDKQIKLWIDADRTTTVPLGVPESGTGFLKGILGSLISIVVYSLLR